MKKILFLLVIFMAVTGAMFAQSAESIFAAIPAAAYTKSDDGSTWIFAVTGLTIRDGSGSRAIPIRDMRDLKAVTDGGSTGFSFSYDTAAYKRTYRVVTNPMTGALTVTIIRDGVALPEARLIKQ